VNQVSVERNKKSS